MLRYAQNDRVVALVPRVTLSAAKSLARGAPSLEGGREGRPYISLWCYLLCRHSWYTSQ